MTNAVDGINILGGYISAVVRVRPRLVQARLERYAQRLREQS